MCETRLDSQSGQAQPLPILRVEVYGSVSCVYETTCSIGEEKGIRAEINRRRKAVENWSEQSVRGPSCHYQTWAVVATLHLNTFKRFHRGSLV